MSTVEQEKIKVMREQVQGSKDLGQGHKDALTDMLIATSHAANGAPDKIQALTEAMVSFGICIARDALHRPSDFRSILNDSLETHTKNCPLVMAKEGVGNPCDTGMTVIQGHGVKAQGKPSTVLIVSGMATVSWLAFLAAKVGGVL